MLAVFRNRQDVPVHLAPLLGALIPVQAGADIHAISVTGEDARTDAYSLGAASSHVAVFAAAGSNASIFLDCTADAPDTSCAIELFLEENARVTLLFAQRSTSSVVRVSQCARLGAGARLHMHNMSIGGEQVTHDLVSFLEGAHAESSVDWAFYARGREKYALNARNVFNGRNGGGEILLKGVAEETATARCDGMIEIGEGGGGTQTYLTEDVLMLDSTAKVDAIPALEIRTNDVKASHSATVSRVSEAELFYFAARGIPQPLARRMYVQGFLADVLKNVQVPEWREVVEAALAAKYQSPADGGL